MGVGKTSTVTGAKPRGFDRGNGRGGRSMPTSTVTGPKQIPTVHPQDRPVTRSEPNLKGKITAQTRRS